MCPPHPCEHTTPCWLPWKLLVHVFGPKMGLLLIKIWPKDTDFCEGLEGRCRQATLCIACVYGHLEGDTAVAIVFGSNMHP